MNTKLILGLVLALLLGGAWFYNSKNEQSATTPLSTQITSTTGQNSAAPQPAGESRGEVFEKKIGDSHIARDQDGFIDREMVPASQKYKSAEEAIAAIKTAAIEYDDFVLEEFVQLKDCSWCDEMYSQVAKLMNDPSIDIDQRSYYGELLAVSGKLENVKALVAGLEQAKGDDEKDMFAESLELAVGNDEMVSYLSKYLENDDEALRESAVAAISNQGSRFAAETLYKDLLSGKAKDHDYYSLGIGLGEMVPDEEALPFLQDLVIKRDQYADLAIKALINSGLHGLTIVFDSLASEKDEAKGKALLVDAIDHVISEEGVDKFLTAATKNDNYPPFLKEFAANALEEAKADELDDLE